MDLVILNIGLARSANLTARKDPVTPGEALRALALAGFTVRSADIAVSATEETLIVHGDQSGMDWTYERVATLLDQDCIAVWYLEEQHGFLHGALAHLWGDFNPEYFLPRGVAK